MKIHDPKIEERILVCAENLILDKGLRGWNMDQLAAQAGMAKNTLYKIIGSKEKLIEIIVFNKAEYSSRMMFNIIDNEPDYSVAMHKLFSVLPDFFGTYNKFLGEIFMEYPALEEKLIRRRQELSAVIYNFFQKGKDNGILRADVDPMILIETLQAVTHFFLRHKQDSASFEKDIKVAFEYVIYGIWR
jgi:AcrR family transcriptional regulator